MNEDSVALIMCEKCVYRIRILNKQGSGTIVRHLFKIYFLFNYNPFGTVIFELSWRPSNE